MRGGAQWEREADLSAFIYKDELDGLVGFGGRGDLGGDPAQLLVRKPYPGALAVYVFRHGGCRTKGSLPNRAST